MPNNIEIEYERPPFELPVPTEEALERGTRMADGLRSLAHVLNESGARYDSKLLEVQFEGDTCLVIPDYPVSFHTMAWKAHKGTTALTEEKTTLEPFLIKDFSVQPTVLQAVPDWTDLKVFGRSNYWKPRIGGVNAHEMFIQYNFPLNGVSIALFDKN